MQASIYSFPAYKDCRFCRGRGCVCCASEREKGIRAEAPLPPVQVEKKPDFLYHSALIRRGWTEQMIEEFLIEPDKTKRNMFGVDCRLYRRTRVEEAEASGEFKTKHAAGDAGRRRARKAVETKRQKIQEEIRSIEIRLPDLSPQELIRRAVRNRNARLSDHALDEGAEFARAEEIPLWPYPDPFRDRICVNYLRHRGTRYDGVLRSLVGKIGKEEAARILREKVYNAIAAKYEYLTEECGRQLQERSQI